MNKSLPRRAVAEFTGTLFLVATVVGSSVMASASPMATSRSRYSQIPLPPERHSWHSFSHSAEFPARISIPSLRPWTPSSAVYRGEKCLCMSRRNTRRDNRGSRCTFHVWPLANLLLTPCTQRRCQVFSEFVATFGLICVIRGWSRWRSSAVPFAVGAYITAAFWFTASTSFANPAVTIARSLSDTFAGIRPADALGFVGAQLLGAFAATLLFRCLFLIFKLGRRKLFCLDKQNSLRHAGGRRLCPKGIYFHQRSASLGSFASCSRNVQPLILSLVMCAHKFRMRATALAALKPRS
jgi:hypothetical protein